MGLLFGLVPTGPAVPGGSPTPDKDAAERLRELWHRLGQPAEQLADVVVTPTCGLAGASPDDARAALVRCTEVARLLTDDPEGPRG